MEDVVYEAIKKLLRMHVRTWKGVKTQKDGLGYVMARIEEFDTDHDAAYTYAYGKE